MSRICGVVAVTGLVGIAAACDSGPRIDVETITRSPEERPLIDFAHRLDLASIDRARPIYRFDRATAGHHLRSGWSDPESPRGIPFAWAMSERAELSLRVLDRTARWLHFTAQPFTVGNARQSAQIQINDVDVGDVTLEGGGFQTYTLRLPADAVRAGENLVSFEFDYAISPQSLNAEALDARPLAAMFRHVEISTSAEPDTAPEPEPPGSRPSTDAPTSQRQTHLELEGTSQAVFRISVPIHGRLEFGQEGTATSAGASRVEVALRLDDETEHVFFSAPPVADPASWLADLSAFEGREAELVFRAVGGRPDQPAVRWTPPRLYGTTGEEDLTTNVVLIVVDTLRADVLGSYGGPVPTPNIDALATSGVRFERAYSHIPITVPSHSSMFTSRLPTEHAAINNGYVLDEAHVTLAERLHNDTYRRTAAFLSLGVLKSQFGLAQGFDEYEDTFDTDWWKTADEINDLVLPWLAQRDADPFFLWVHYSDPHEPYTPPARKYPTLMLRTDSGVERPIVADSSTQRIPLDPSGTITRVTLSSTERLPWRIKITGLRARGEDVVTCDTGCRERSPAPGLTQQVLQLPVELSVTHVDPDADEHWIQLRAGEDLPPREARIRYEEEVEYVDRAIGELLAALRERGDNPLIIFTADHGEDLGEHGAVGHVTRLYDTTIRVPLIFSWPGVLPAGRVVDERVSHIDLLPTLFELLGLSDSETRSGRSLLAQLSGSPSTAAEPRPVFAETFRPESTKDRQAVVAEAYKLIATPEDKQEELYNLDADPGEVNDLAQDEPELAHRLSRLLRQRLTRARQEAGTSEVMPIDEEELEKFRALGYIR